MYSHEIEQLLKLKNYLVDVKDYINIIESPQVKDVEYEGNNNFKVITKDGYSFSFRIVYNTKK